MVPSRRGTVSPANSRIGPLRRSGSNRVLAAPRRSAGQARDAVLSAPPSGSTARSGGSRPLTPEAVIALVESFMAEAWAARRSVGGGSLRDRGFRHHAPAGVDVAGRENFKAWVAGFHRGLPTCSGNPSRPRQRRRLARVVAVPRHRPQQRHVRVAGGSQADRVDRATQSWRSHPPGSSRITGSSAAPGSSITS